MSEHISLIEKVAPAFAGWLAFVSITWPFFKVGEILVSPMLKKEIIQWLRNSGSANLAATWPNTMPAVLDRVFGERHLSLKCFGRSCLASIVVVLALALIYVVQDFEVIRASRFAKEPLFNNSKFAGIGVVVFSITLSLFLNVIPDYIALLKTRYVLGWMTRQPTTIRKSLFFIIDSLLSACIAVISLLALTFVVVALMSYSRSQDVLITLIEVVRSDEFLNELITDVTYGLRLQVPPEEVPLPWGIFFYSTYMTSLWIWLYVLGGTICRLVDWARIGVYRIYWMFDFNKRPIESIGFISVTTCSAVYWISILIVWLIQR